MFIIKQGFKLKLKQTFKISARKAEKKMRTEEYRRGRGEEFGGDALQGSTALLGRRRPAMVCLMAGEWWRKTLWGVDVERERWRRVLGFGQNRPLSVFLKSPGSVILSVQFH